MSVVLSPDLIDALPFLYRETGWRTHKSNSKALSGMMLSSNSLLKVAVVFLGQEIGENLSKIG